MTDLEIAKSYFIKLSNYLNYKYIGPKDEYQKWYYILHKDHKNENSKKWRINNYEKDKIRNSIKGRKTRFNDKLNALKLVSNTDHPKCCICGIDDIRLLTINHLNGDGCIERKNNKYRVSRIYRDIKNGRTTSDLDVRCYNCNIIYEYETGNRKLPLN